MFIKLSISVFLLRICVHKVQRTAIYATAAVMTVMSISYTFVFLFQCYPITYFWTQYVSGKGSCLNANILVDVVSNFVLVGWAWMTVHYISTSR